MISNNSLFFYSFLGSIGTQNVKAGNVVKMNAALSDSRNIQFASSSTDSNFSIMIFAGILRLLQFSFT